MSTKLAVFGNPINHSLSPLIHQHFAQQFGNVISYSKILVDGSFTDCADEFFAQDGYGCNVTVPCKVDALNYATTLTDRAKVAQAVNTLKAIRDEQGKIIGMLGDNTDGAGLFADLQRLDCPLHGADVMILGAGGATRGIVPPLLDQIAHIKSLTIVNRTLSKAEEIAKSSQKYIESLKAKFEAKNQEEGTIHEWTWPVVNALSYSQLHSHCYFAEAHAIPRYQVIINATSLSLIRELPGIDDVLYQHADFVYDLYYTVSGSTSFTSYAKEQGVKNAYDGLGMLVSQAALSYEQWFGVRPDVTQTIEFLRETLKKY